MQQAHILVVEDDKNVAEGLRDIFSAQSYTVDLAETNADALKFAETGEIDLAVLDVSLGTDSGYELCSQIRRFSDMPILFLTARNSEMELIRGFQAGGDDYLTKPFRMQELLMRVQALLRRTARKEPGTVKTGDLTLDMEKHLLKRDGEPVSLSGVEWKIVSSLIAHYPHALNREELLYFVWDTDSSFVEANTLNVNVSRLREKLGNCKGRPYIETVRGVGYRWAVQVER
ncbi:MAG: response regulator transcription factor [Acutalibacter sp.]|nr:response regulator transcription factor [Acutalibacter sp.]